MTKRRFAVTSRSAAFSSPFWARRARRRSSSGSSIRGSFWMSWRYWSNAVEGDERKYPLEDLVSVTCSIHAPHQEGVRWSEHHGWAAPPVARWLASGRAGVQGRLG